MLPQTETLKDSDIQELSKLNSKCVYSRHFVKKFKQGKVDRGEVLPEMKSLSIYLCLKYTAQKRPQE